MGTRTSIWAGAAALVTMLGSTLILSPAAGAASPADQGVTAKTIAVGLPYVNFQALKSLGVTINDGNFPDAYRPVIADINAKGGINGRKLVLSSVEMNPAVPAKPPRRARNSPRTTTSSSAISPVFPACYQQTHDTLGDRRFVAGTAVGHRGAGLHPHPSRRRTSTRCSSPPSRRPVISRARRWRCSTARLGRS